MAGLCCLSLESTCDVPSQAALQRLSGMTCLRWMQFNNMYVLHSEMVMLQSLASLKSLVLCNLPKGALDPDSFEGGMPSFCRAIGRLTQLKTLDMQDCTAG